MKTLCVVAVASVCVWARVLDVTQGAGTYPTVQSAANAAAPGDTVRIHAGIYRETVRPARSGTAAMPIVFQGVAGDSVTISAADPVGGWTPHDITTGRRIFRAPMPFTCNVSSGLGSAGNDQVFVNGEMMVEARWPNLPDSAHPAGYRKEYGATSTSGSRSGTAWTYAAAGIPGAGNSLVGGYVNTLPGAKWTSGTGRIASSANGSLTAEIDLPDESYYNPRAGDLFYVWGALALLDHAREWCRDAQGTLYLWAPQGADPATLRVEAKRRTAVFDITDRAYITLRELTLTGGTILNNTGSHHLTIENARLLHLSHYQMLGSAWSVRQVGLLFDCDSVMIRGCDVAHSAEIGIKFIRNNCLAENNVIRNCTYVGQSGAGLWLHGDRNVARNNTVFTMGNVNVFVGDAISAPATTRSLVTNNDVYDGYISSTDGGLVFQHRNTNTQGSVVCYNWIHGAGQGGDYGSGGFYTEGGVSNLTIHHNIIWGSSASGGLNLGPGGEGTLNGINVYNNTMWNCKWNAPAGSLGCNGNFRNNISDGQVFGNFWGTVDHNLDNSQNAGLTDPANCDFTPIPTGPAVNQGVQIAGITDGFEGSAPDIGAVESGRRPFVAGALVRAQDVAGLRVTYDALAGRFTIADAPLGRYLPDSFALKVGTGVAGGVVKFAYLSKTWAVTGVSVPAAGGVVYALLDGATPLATSLRIANTGLRGAPGQRGLAPWRRSPRGLSVVRFSDPRGADAPHFYDLHGKRCRGAPSPATSPAVFVAR